MFERRADDPVANLADALCYDGVRVNHFNVGWVLTPNEYEYNRTTACRRTGRTTSPPIGPDRSMITRGDRRGRRVLASDESRPISGSVVEFEQYPFIGRNPTKRGE